MISAPLIFLIVVVFLLCFVFNAWCLAVRDDDGLEFFSTKRLAKQVFGYGGSRQVLCFDLNDKHQRVVGYVILIFGVPLFFVLCKIPFTVIRWILSFFIGLFVGLFKGIKGIDFTGWKNRIALFRRSGSFTEAEMKRILGNDYIDPKSMV